MHSLNGVASVVTGAGRGIGREIACRLAAAGARVTLVARSQADLDAVAATIAARGGEALAVAADVTDAHSVARAFDAARARFGVVRVLVNNAGTPGPYGPIGVADPREWWASQQLHQLAPLMTMHNVIPGMQRAGGGRIINIVSSAGLQAIPHLSAYAVGKCAAIRLTETVDLEQRAHGIRAFALQPGTIVTDMARSTMGSAEARRWIPDGVAMLAGRSAAESAADLNRCGDVVTALAAGRYDALAGRYLDIQWDFDARAREATATAPA
jgi:NAD(P)-dependent dehydrogenase (short-subunit alcohol dehydrogenase family)